MEEKESFELSLQCEPRSGLPRKPEKEKAPKEKKEKKVKEDKEENGYVS